MNLIFILSTWAQAVPASPDYPGHCQSPVWSPDGSRLSWEVNYLERKAIDLYVATFNESAGTPRKISPPRPASSSLTEGFAGNDDSVAHELTFAPPSIGRFIYSSSGTTRDYDLFLDSGGGLAAVPGTDGGATWSPDGGRVVFSSARTGQGDLYLIDMRNPAQAPRRLTGDETASELYAAWSPDSRSIAFVGHTPKGDNVWLIDNLDFPSPRPLTTWSHTQTRPSWSPDGRNLAFYSNHNDPNRYDLYSMSIGGLPLLIATDVQMNPRGPAWSPDGRYLIYVKQNESAFNPIYAAPISDPAAARAIPTGTVGNDDLAVVRSASGVEWLAVAAQGRVTDAVRDFRRIYVMRLPKLP